jgi:uncharacterized protein YndB with AHSA1/START domain
MQRVEKIIEIDAPIEHVFDLFSDFENFPRWMRHIRDVHYSGRGFTRWSADAPLGTSVEWEAETTDFDPPHRIAWESVRGDVDTEGDVTFRETRRGTTMVRVRLGYSPPAGRLGALVASLFGNDPEQQLEEDLSRFAEVAERGRRPHQPRPRERYREPQRFAPERELYDRREAEREMFERRGFDEPQRRRMERGYEEERARNERRPPEREERRLDFDAEWDERLGRPRGRREREDAEESAHRHALTPREREREQAERRPDFDYSREAFRRGVDRLMDEPPSRNWRRWD